MYDLDKVVELEPKFLREHIDIAFMWEHYTGIRFKPGTVFSSPLREDNNPSASFFVASDGNYLMKDFSTGKTYNIFSYLMEDYGLSFPKALKKLAEDSGIIKSKGMYKKVQRTHINNPHKIYQSVTKKWDEETLAYWKTYGIKEVMLKEHNVYPCQIVSINDFNVKLWSKSNPVYRYEFGKNRKFYCPYDEKFKFFGHSCLQHSTLYRDDILVITKSYKDVMCFSLYDIDAVAPASESTKITRSLANKIMARYDKVYINGDDDYTGNIFMDYHKDTYGFIPLKIKHDFCKDFADLQQVDRNACQNLINSL